VNGQAPTVNPPGPPGPPGRLGRLPERLRPRDSERPGRGDLRRIESTLLALVFVLLAVAVVNDVVRKVERVDERIAADRRTWREATGHNYKDISFERDLFSGAPRDVLCGSTRPAPPDAAARICLLVVGPVSRGRRAAAGGFYLPPHVPDKRMYRYACFGTAVAENLCGRPTPRGAPSEPLTHG
jgi:hypothetical protein